MSTHDFLHAMYGNLQSGYLEVRVIGTDFRRQMYRPLPLPTTLLNFDKLHEMNEHHNIYFRVAVSDKQSSRKADITLITALWCDIDSGDCSALDSITPRPNVVIKSGRGYHGYWLLDTPLAITPSNLKDVEQTLQGIALAVKGDEKCKDVTRILRLPGFINKKPEYDALPIHAKMCKLLKLDDSPLMRVSWEEMYNAFAELGAPIPPRITRSVPSEAQSRTLPNTVKDYLAHGAPAGERNSMLFWCACRYHDAGYSDSEAHNELGARAAIDGLSAQEIATAIRSAYAQPITPQLPRHMATIAAWEDTYV